MVKIPPANARDTETRVQSPGGDDPLGQEMATHSSILAGIIRCTQDRVGYSAWGCKELDMSEHLSTHTGETERIFMCGICRLVYSLLC